MSKLQISSLLTIGLGLVMAASIAVAALGFAVPDVGAQALTPDDLFGGDATNSSGATFANETGLSDSDLVPTISQIIRVVLGFLGIVAVFIILLGGFKWMTSGGADEKVRDAKKLMIAGCVGLAIVLAAYAIAAFVIESLTSALANSAT